MQQRPNILFILTDTQPTALVECYSGQAVETPNLDALAASGLRFDRAYTTCPLCTPARSAIFTGMTPSRNGAYSNNQPLGDTIKTMGQRFRDQGYRSAYIGKWHLDGHDYFGDGRCPDGWEDGYWYDGKRYLLELSPEDAKRWRLEWSRYEDLKELGVTSEDTWGHRISDRAERFLDEQVDDSRPFLLVASYDEPHHPWTCPPEFVERFQGKSIDIGPGAFDSLENKPAHQQRWAREAGVQEPTGKYGNTMALACNSYIDTQIGRVINKARAICEARNEPLWIVYTSDHGDHMGAHRLMTKGSTGYEENTRIPFIVSPPSETSGLVQQSLVSHLDILPTFMEIAGIPQPDCLDGRSILSLCESEEVDSERRVFTEYTRHEVGHDGFGGLLPMRMWMRGPWKLVINLFHTDELYNLEEDPAELDNRIDDPACADERDSLHTELIEWMYEHIDPQRGEPWEKRPWHTIEKPVWNAPMRPVPDDGYRPTYIDYDTGMPTRGVAKQFE